MNIKANYNLVKMITHILEHLKTLVIHRSLKDDFIPEEILKPLEEADELMKNGIYEKAYGKYLNAIGNGFSENYLTTEYCKRLDVSIEICNDELNKLENKLEKENSLELNLK